MDEIFKRYILTMLTPPKHISELLDFVEESYQNGNISSSEYVKWLSTLQYFYDS
ncbi:hypothetical protein [Ammoniphilus resinae]|uniref:YozE SAM-like domain-containing protein n=1 Tax=Ammoniphilus resinae TaxID=861532 RepID=A0ABS4GPK6_9BACL|nr:hypothetical protein [Ammoniphilus resinae]MBP1932210.1 hypothetical protein [Ammoniphilus resinae]